MLTFPACVARAHSIQNKHSARGNENTARCPPPQAFQQQMSLAVYIGTPLYAVSRNRASKLEALVHCCTAATSRGCRCRLSFRNIWSLVSRLPLRSLRHRVSHRRFNRVTRVSIGISSPFENQFQRFVSRWFFGLPECFIWARNFYSQKILRCFYRGLA